MLPRIEISNVVRRAYKAIDEHNNSCPMQAVERRIMTADGKPDVQLIHRRVGLIPEAISTTFHALVTEYVRNYNRTASMMADGAYTKDSPPGLRTNNVRLAPFCRCTDRTVRNHLSRLRELGYIQTKFHGTRKDFEVWISPKFLFEPESEASVNEFKNAPKPQFEGENPKNFPLNSTYIEIIEKKETRKVDMLVEHGENVQGQRGRAETTAVGQQPLNTAGRREDQVGGGGVRPRQAMTSLRLPKPTTPRRNPKDLAPMHLKMLVEFWLYAWRVIYPGRDFNDQEQEAALYAIMAGVYNNFTDPLSDAEWLNVQVYQLSKLDKAGRYFDRHPDAYRPDPYAVVIAGKGYFDRENHLGFIGIEAWMKKDKIEQKRQRDAYAHRKRCDRLLITARRDFLKLRMGLPPRKEVAGKTELGLYQYYDALFAGLGAKYRERFAKQYLDRQTHNFQSPRFQAAQRTRRAGGEVSKEVIVYVENYMEGDGMGYYTD
ncbi:hypothetical protein [Arundinibacter roseus]|uniref:Uncharacterized protein n=1 Tax=Arundinibacter roseus TaxID=2070510 RepID=A0A4R4K227_9BACT|nr:hypothetical protein [Arundinibacter roseus]TDB60069.1 hypothetical protein EZE20_21600 [Arundinibacter roseus]